MKTQGPPLLVVKDLKVHYPVRTGVWNFSEPRVVKAVDGVSLELFPGEVLGLVGESGCGKSSLGRALLRLQEPTSGKLTVLDQNFLNLHGKALRHFRRHIQMVFQDPYASLNPRMTIGEMLAEPLRAHFSLTSGEINHRVDEKLTQVGLSAPSKKKYPHEFSGGQRQRIAIARALILNPKILIADEPVSSLDVSVQAQVLNLLKEIQSSAELSMVFISHNLSVVKTISDRIAVMYLGKIVETGQREELFRSPQHPYTQALISAIPIPDPLKERQRKRMALLGEIPSPEKPPSGCAFHPRCPWRVERCSQDPPELEVTQSSASHRVSCFEAGKAHPL
ncbi:dipeptide ABC transporter ATP-binding protein [bacterium]|nr:dipeptide ABC transporter ATP-binding protein [bacterium]